MALTSRVSVELAAVLTGTADFGAPSSRVNISQQLDLASGTGAGKADKIWSDRRTIAASDSEELDLAGSLTDVFGGTITLATVKVLYVKAAASNTNDVVLGAAAENAWDTLLGDAGTVTLRPGAVFLVAATSANPWGVTASSADLLKVANSSSGSSVSYDIAVVGATATS
ncbi:hypothetical protein [Actinomadura sp. SCN-SB]|uniref:hypothetical protein n=1 Tax=Actinomadura sp. SCN-SB TaxID=3373092 RepID=UPI0037525CED